MHVVLCETVYLLILYIRRLNGILKYHNIVNIKNSLILDPSLCSRSVQSFSITVLINTFNILKDAHFIAFCCKRVGDIENTIN